MWNVRELREGETLDRIIGRACHRACRPSVNLAPPLINEDDVALGLGQCHGRLIAKMTTSGFLVVHCGNIVWFNSIDVLMTELVPSSAIPRPAWLFICHGPAYGSGFRVIAAAKRPLRHLGSHW